MFISGDTNARNHFLNDDGVVGWTGVEHFNVKGGLKLQLLGIMSKVSTNSNNLIH